MSRPTLATIDVGALRNNLAVARRFAPASRIWAVIKAAAYGHGLDRAAQAFDEADGFALLEFDAALRLREANPDRRLLMLEGAFDPGSTALAAERGLELVVHCDEQVAWIESLEGPRRLNIWLKFNNGMNRLGFARAHFRAAFERLVGLPAVARINLMSHFANADSEDAWQEPLARFERAAKGLPGERSLANSAATLSIPSVHAHWIRPGIMLYGASPFGGHDTAQYGLQPAMSLRSSLIAVQSLLPGDTVGYGSQFTAGRPMRIGVVACGYADGYPRSAGTGTPVCVAGRRTRVVGRVSMDMLTVDLDPVPEAMPGADVELWGTRVSVDEVAGCAGTIGYELLCRLAPRVPIQTLAGC